MVSCFVWRRDESMSDPTLPYCKHSRRVLNMQYTWCQRQKSKAANVF